MLRCRYSRYISGRGWPKTKLEIKVVLPIGGLPVALVLHDVLAPVHLSYLLGTRGILWRFVLPNSEGNAIDIKDCVDLNIQLSYFQVFHEVKTLIKTPTTSGSVSLSLQDPVPNYNICSDPDDLSNEQKMSKKTT
jgi:hypothetical protein